MDERQIADVVDALRTLDWYGGNRDSLEYREAVEVITLNAKVFAETVDWLDGRMLGLESELEDERMEMGDLQVQIALLEEKIKEKDERIEELEGMVAEWEKEVTA